jgi:outer membrane lipoprotein LolB
MGLFERNRGNSPQPRRNQRRHLAWPLLASLAAAMLAAGCATPPRPGPSLSTSATSLSTQTSHAYHGRFAVGYTDQYGVARNAYGNFQWQETGETVRLQLLTPLGQTLAIIESAPGSATLELPNQPPQTAPDVTELMQHALGFALPVDGLRYWLQPSPAPASKAQTEADASGRLAHLTQDGWTIDYIAYADAPRSAVKRVNLTRATPPLDIKLVLDQ